MRIAILHEASETPESVRGYSIAALEELWLQSGHSVIHLFGPDRYLEADIILVHVNLSVVSEDYISLARRYSRALNVRITDIRKNCFSQCRVRHDESYFGPVIVKTNLNHAGIPEKHRSTHGKEHRPFWKKIFRSSPLKYPIYASPSKVPTHCWGDKSLVVEKFLPEIHDGFYFLRQSYFLGERHRSWRLRSAHPIIRGDNILDDVEIPTPQAVEDFRRGVGLDYGKIDFVEHDGRITILDLNKTIGGPAPPVTVAHLAPALDSFFIHESTF